LAGRRAVLKSALCLGFGLVVGPELALGQDDPASMRPKEGDLLIGTGDSTMKPLTADDILPGAAPTLAWSMDPSSKTVRSGSRFNRVLLVRLDAGKLSADTRTAAAEGIVAYTSICTHAGCDVGDWLAGEQLLYCSCHSSKFDPGDGARVVDGPAPRSLPALPLRIADRNLVVAGPFTARVGFESA
jgi:rieske iron-sulfur protein